MKIKSKLSTKDKQVLVEVARKHFSHLAEAGMLIDRTEAGADASELAGIIKHIDATTNAEVVAKKALYNAVYVNDTPSDERADEPADEPADELVDEDESDLSAQADEPTDETDNTPPADEQTNEPVEAFTPESDEPAVSQPAQEYKAKAARTKRSTNKK